MCMGSYEYYFGVCHLLPCTLIHIILYCKSLACSLRQWRLKCHLKSRCYADYKNWHTCFQSINWIEITSVDQTPCFTVASWISQYTSNLSGPRALTTYFGLSRAQRALPWSNWFTVTLFHCDEEVAHVGLDGKNALILFFSKPYGGLSIYFQMQTQGIFKFCPSTKKQWWFMINGAPRNTLQWQ